MAGMRFSHQGTHLIVKSLGYGVLVAELMPGDSIGNDILNKLAAEQFATTLQAIYIYPNNPHKAVIMLNEGQAPTSYEKNQITPEDMMIIKNIAESVDSKVFLDRLIIIEQAFAQLDASSI